ncbi:hypothetical protein TGVAND_246150 [Toxoplasma gondii VAND]|uniref:Uncharacterized protein n=1 Tax=Toxoplasma gondii VAND TaxID=933077 RepID=A0A086QIP2_TOXGO|nr:hypothetical protein TGVAND_246150 [Toxoplasma gondii VAND]
MSAAPRGIASPQESDAERRDSADTRPFGDFCDFSPQVSRSKERLVYEPTCAGEKASFGVSAGPGRGSLKGGTSSGGGSRSSVVPTPGQVSACAASAADFSRFRFFTFLSGVSRVSSKEPHVGLLARDARDQTAKATPPGEPCRVLRTSRRRPGFRERESRKKCRMHAPDGSDPSRAGRRARLKRGRRRGSALQRWLAEETETGRSRASSRQWRVNRKSENGGRAA